MIDFLTSKYRLNQNKAFDPDTYREIIHCDTENNAAVLFSYWDADQYVETRRGNKWESSTARELYSHRGPIDLEDSGNLLYSYDPTESLIKNFPDPEKPLYDLKEIGLSIIGNNVTIYNVCELAGNVFNEMPLTYDGYTVDLKVGSKYNENVVSGVVTEISYYNESYVFTIGNQYFGAYELCSVRV